MQVLKQCGLEWDEPMVQQSTRLPEYKKVADVLISKNKAYRCFCSKERLDRLRSAQAGESQQTRYDGKCSHLTAAEADSRAGQGEPFTVRMKSLMTGETIVKDEIVGTVKFSNAVAMDDQILLKQDGWPTYHLAAIVDDHEMEITHVVRGEEWLPSTPKHLALYEMMGWTAPRFAHLPLLLTPDGKKLSKRSPMGASVESLLEKGYLPSALLNFVVLLGWSPHAATGSSTSNIIFYDKKEIVDKFSLENVTRGAAVVDEERLGWINAMHIREAIKRGKGDSNYETISSLVRKECSQMPTYNEAKMERMLDALKERMRFPMDFVRLGSHFFHQDCELNPIPKDVVEGKDLSIKVLDTAIQMLSNNIDSRGELESLHTKMGIRKRDVLNTLRWALTGQAVGAPIPDTVRVMDPGEAVYRLQRARDVLGKGP